MEGSGELLGARSAPNPQSGEVPGLDSRRLAPLAVPQGAVERSQCSTGPQGTRAALSHHPQWGQCDASRARGEFFRGREGETRKEEKRVKEAKEGGKRGRKGPT